MVPALVKLIDDERSVGQAYNLGGAQEISISDLAHQIVDRLQSDSMVSLVPYKQAYAAGYEDMRRRVPDNTKANKLIGFVPETLIPEIIDFVAADLRARNGLEHRMMQQAGSLLSVAV